VVGEAARRLIAVAPRAGAGCRALRTMVLMLALAGATPVQAADEENAAGAGAHDGASFSRLQDGWRISGQCRGGRAQGAYVLHAADGRMRVQGAYNHGQRAGSFFFWSADGARIAQLPFDDDVLSGTLSLWYDGAGGEPLRKLEAAYRNGERDGPTRLWSADGRLRGEFEYAGGRLSSQRAYDDAGTSLPDAQARALAERERAETGRFVEDLLATLRRHPPDCHPPPARLRAAAPIVPSTSPMPSGGTS
jgi:hypothetical protein